MSKHNKNQNNNKRNQHDIEKMAQKGQNESCDPKSGSCGGKMPQQGQSNSGKMPHQAQSDSNVNKSQSGSSTQKGGFKNK